MTAAVTDRWSLSERGLTDGKTIRQRRSIDSEMRVRKSLRWDEEGGCWERDEMLLDWFDLIDDNNVSIWRLLSYASIDCHIIRWSRGMHRASSLDGHSNRHHQQRKGVVPLLVLSQWLVDGRVFDCST